jgi:cytochrome c oxidase subunit 2
MGSGDAPGAGGSRGSHRHWLYATSIWVVVTIALEIVAAHWSLLPARMSEEAHVVDDAFDLLIVLAIPVFTFVVVALGYSAIAWRSSDPAADGAGTASSSRVLGIWLVVTSLLAVFVFVNPGLIGLRELRADEGADLVVHAEARRFKWTFTYPGERESDELYLPVDTRVKFEITSLDVLHSFWIPSFRMKIDAVPGRVTELYVTPDTEGTVDDIPGMRVQCAELCGIGHGRMFTPVHVVSDTEYDAFVESLEVEE